MDAFETTNTSKTMTKTIIIHHSADYDGRFCREVAKRAIPHAEVIGWDFADAPLPDDLLYENLIILDLPVDRPFGLVFKEGWICKDGDQKQPLDRWDSSNVIWIDHHSSSIMSHPASIPGYRIDGVAACRLAWQWFLTRNTTNALPSKDAYINRLVREPLAIRLAGEYDIWDKRDSRTDTFQYALRSCDPAWSLLLDGDEDVIFNMLVAGAACQRYAERENESLAKYKTYMVEWEGLKFLTINTARFNSLLFKAKDVPETGHDALMGYNFNGKQFVVSLYHAAHRKDIDLSKIAVKYGGGGHKGACGFACATLPF